MKIIDAYVYFRGLCPIGKSLDDFIREAAQATTPLGGVRDMAQKLLDAEEVFLPDNERTLRQLQHPGYKLNLDNLPPGISGEVTGLNNHWTTDSSTPYALSTIYTKGAPQ